ncbi:endonuclease MutS2 [Thermodesulfovibrio hydrogeniphilus]
MISRKALEDLDYFKALNLISEFSNSDATKQYIEQLYPCEALKESEAYLREFQEIKEYLDKGGEIPISPFPSISELLNKASKEGAFFDGQELSKFLKVLRVLDRVSPFVDELLNLPYLSRRIKSILESYLAIGQPYLLEKLENSIDEDGNILDTASSVLKYVRKQIKITEERIKEKLEEIINRKETVVFLQDRFITKRNDRWVIPVRMDSKGMVKGKVYDVSRSGETAFIEPEEIASLSKKLEELKIEERVEEIRILKELSNDIHQISETLQREFNLLLYLDRLLSIYKYSQKFKAEVPKITDSQEISLISARHPLLMLTKENVVPLDLGLKEKKVLVISGPNAGGKTVTLKTIGLLTAMALSGLPIPASASSVIPFVKSIYVDLYHEGSIEEQLSSFASHVMTLKEIVKKADSESLVLIDEIGTNTDPEEGSALACAIIEELKNRGSFTFVTTHLSKVKLFAVTQEGMEVAAMLFDEATMTPLYKLSIGTLTTSYALETAKKYGFPEKLIKRAYELKGGQEDVKIYKLMNELERMKEEYQAKIDEIEKVKKTLLSEKEILERQKREIEEKRKEILEKAKKEANELIQKIKKELNILYEEAKKADRKKLKEIYQKTSEIAREFQSAGASAGAREINVGDFVKVKSLNLKGKVISIEDKKVKIQTETAQIEAKIEDVEKIAGVSECESVREKGMSLHAPSHTLTPALHKLDIRGMRVDEAIPIVERFLNELSLEGASEGIIIHGIGKGILRDAIRQYVKEHPAVKSTKKGSPDEGGDAVTVVELK